MSDIDKRSEYYEYELDGEPLNLAEFLAQNVHNMTDDERVAVLSLAPGETYRFGGGAFVVQELRRVA